MDNKNQFGFESLKKVIIAPLVLTACGTPGLNPPTSSSSSSQSSSYSSSVEYSSSSSYSSSFSSDHSSSSSVVSSSSSSSGGDVVFQDDFESYEHGAFPAAPWRTRIGFDTSSGDTSRVYVTDDAYSGSSAVVVSSPGAFDPSFIFLNFADSIKQAQQLYVRMYLKASAGLGGDGGHAHILELSKDGQNGVRYGEANGSIGVNTVEGGDPLSPQPNQENNDLSANQWHCLEVLFDKGPQYHELTTWVEGALVHRISNDAGQWENIWTNNGPAPNWLEKAFDHQIQFGWYAFSGVRGNTLTFDDLVISTERIGCNYLPTGVYAPGVD